MFISNSLNFALLCFSISRFRWQIPDELFLFHSSTEWNAERPKCGCHKAVNDFSIWKVIPTMIIIIAVSFRTKNQQTNRRQRIDVKMDRLFQRWQFLFVILTFDFFLFFFWNLYFCWVIVPLTCGKYLEKSHFSIIHSHKPSGFLRKVCGILYAQFRIELLLFPRKL